MINEITAIKILNSGLVGALVAGVALDASLATVLVVGVVGGLAYTAKEFVLEHFKDSPIKYVIKMFTTTLMSMALVGFVFYLGRDGFNAHVKDIGNPVWIFLAFMVGLNQKTAIDLVTMVSKGVYEVGYAYLKNRFGGSR